MVTSSSAAGPALVWLLVAFLFSLVVALGAALLKTKEGAKATAIISFAAVAFAGSMALCLSTLGAADLL